MNLGFTNGILRFKSPTTKPKPEMLMRSKDTSSTQSRAYPESKGLNDSRHNESIFCWWSSFRERSNPARIRQEPISCGSRFLLWNYAATSERHLATWCRWWRRLGDDPVLSRLHFTHASPPNSTIFNGISHSLYPYMCLNVIIFNHIHLISFHSFSGQRFWGVKSVGLGGRGWWHPQNHCVQDRINISQLFINSFSQVAEVLKKFFCIVRTGLRWRLWGSMSDS